MTNKCLILLVALCLHIRLTLGDTEDITSLSAPSADDSETQIEKSDDTDIDDLASRGARHMNVDRADYVLKPNGKNNKRQVIKINGNVSKIKVMPKKVPVSSSNVHNIRQPPQRLKYQASNPIRNQAPKRGRLGPTKQSKRPIYDYEFEYDEPAPAPPPKRVKKQQQKKKPYYIKEVSPQEFFDDDDFEANSPVTFVQKPLKKVRKSRPSEYEEPTSYTSLATGYDEERRPSRRPNQAPIYEYDDEEFSETKVQSPNYGLNIVEPPNLKKTVKKSKAEMPEKSFGSKTPEISRPYGNIRQMHSLFPNQYTSHNPYVTTNFGPFESEEKNKHWSDSENSKPWSQMYDDSGSDGHRENKINNEFSPGNEVYPFEFGANVGQRSEFQQSVASSEIHSEAVPPSGLHVVQPPQFRAPEQSNNELSRYKESPVGPTATSSSTSQQKATLKDILIQDCPGSDVSGFCASPPRYPTHQISSVLKRCSEIMESLYSVAPPEPEDDFSSFSRRMDDDLEYESDNTTSVDAKPSREVFSWARSDNFATACGSDLHLVEPGYAQEVGSGRWFVIVQTLDGISQKVTVDTCQRPGKSCAGLTSMKCSRSNSGFRNGVKSTRCLQRYTHHRLVSWDPESPLKCPKIRVFKFPTACVCHLGLV